MVGEEAALEIQVLQRHGKGIRKIARATGLSRNTVTRASNRSQTPARDQRVEICAARHHGPRGSGMERYLAPF